MCCLHTFSLPGARLSFSLHRISFQKISSYHRSLEIAHWNLCHSLSSPIGTEKRSRSYVFSSNIQFIHYFRSDLFCRHTVEFFKRFATKKSLGGGLNLQSGPEVGLISSSSSRNVDLSPPLCSQMYYCKVFICFGFICTLNLRIAVLNLFNSINSENA